MSAQRLSRLPHLFLTLFILSSARAAPTNITIDDTNSTYFTWTEDPGIAPVPLLPWAAITPLSPCDYCSAQPQTTDIYNQTWHDGGNNSAGSFTFQGSAVYIYGIDLDNGANISFSLDGNVAPFHYYAGSEQFVFKSLFFNAEDLTASVNHTVSWDLHATKTNGSTGLFDYAIITVDEDVSSTSPSGTTAPGQSSTSSVTSKSKSKRGPIVGGVVGGLALIASVAAAVIFRPRRQSSNVDGEPKSRPGRVRANYVEPFVGPAPAVSTPTSGSGAESKMLDVAWNNPAPLTYSAPTITSTPPTTNTLPVQSTTDVSSLSPTLPLAATDASSSIPDTSPTASTRLFESRLALLEAQVNEHLVLPPPYVPPPPSEA